MCFDHWVVDWIGKLGDTKGARWVYGAVFVYTFTGVVGQLVGVVTGAAREPFVIQLALLAIAGWSGGFFAAMVWEHPFGGRLWFGSSPVLSVALTLSAAEVWFGDGGEFLLGSMRDSQLGRALVALYAVVFAIMAVIEWARCFLHVRGRYRWSDNLALLGNVLMGFVLLIIVGLVIASRGTESNRLVYIAAALAALGLVRSARQITEFVRRLRI
jgi:hypothetical protein